MNLRLGQISGFKSSMSKLAGAVNIPPKPNSEILARAKQMETIRSCKPFKAECEICKDKIGLLNDDLFVRSSDNLKISK